MENEIINSQDYWDNRFATDWIDYAGDKQTAFFATVLCRAIPDLVVKEVMSNEYTVCDMGCALGDGVPIYSRRFGVDVEGMDFSVEAIKVAKEKYPQNAFWVGDLQNIDSGRNYDVTICSNVLEHFFNPWKIFKNLARITVKYIIIMVPYKEQLEINEHLYHFSEDVIPVDLAEFILEYVRVIDCRDIPENLYPDRQILLVYKKKVNRNIQMLNELTDSIAKSFVMEELKEKDKVLNNKELLINELTDKFTMAKEKIGELEEKLQEKDIEIKEKNKALQEKDKALQEKDKALQEKDKTLQEKDKALQEKDKALQDKEVTLQEKETSMNVMENNLLKKEHEIVGYESRILNARTTCYKINSGTSYRIVCALGRFVNQFLKGGRKEKKEFLSICWNFITRKRSEFTRNDGYNMVLNISNILGSSTEQPQGLTADGEDIGEKKAIATLTSISPITQKCLEQEYSKPDIIIFSVINYDFRYQRPQHFASRFAENGHRVFYVNANFTNKDSVKNVADNLYIIDWANDICNAVYYLSDWKRYEDWFKSKASKLIYQYAIKDAIIILDYPNWVYGAEYLREFFGFRMIVDYMDDFTGFLGTTTSVLKDNCIHMLTVSDLVIASSQFLGDIAQKYTSKFSIVHNGTEVKHFYRALEKQTHKKRPVIGYYGAVAHWFDWEKVCYVAENMPDCDVVIIGEITEHRDKLEKYNNIKLLGEKNYKELPEHLAYFDVCLIPFDTSTDLIKATNPVKFYEYLSAGKSIVATEIPELEPYRDQYVYMSNDNEVFLNYVRLCLNTEDELKSKEECVAFAKENDWQKRYEAFADACLSSTPKVSIIVLTYNNLELNKVCIDSILRKTAYPNYELIILDNMSTDGTVEYLQELNKLNDPRIKIIFNDKNSGFAGGNNKAIRESDGEYIMLLNNDTIVTRGWLTNAVKHLSNDKNCGMCGAVTNSIGNEAMIAVNYKNEKELDRFAYFYTSLHNNEVYTDVDRIAMFGTIIRRSIMDQYGMLDENYQVGMFEDDDYAKVVEKAGYSFYIAEDVFIHHEHKASFKRIDSEEYTKIFNRNREYFEKKWSTKWKMPKYREGVGADINKGMMV